MSLFPMNCAGRVCCWCKQRPPSRLPSWLPDAEAPTGPLLRPINPTGPAPQPHSLVAVVSSPSPTTPGIATILDYAGDTVMAQAPIGPGPLAFSVDENGSTGYTVNSDGTLTNFTVSTIIARKERHVFDAAGGFAVRRVVFALGGIVGGGPEWEFGGRADGQSRRLSS